MNTIPANEVQLDDSFWGPRLKINAEKAIYHQWDQLVKSGCIQNFRLVTGEEEGEFSLAEGENGTAVTETAAPETETAISDTND